jgi:hypothetical protein
MALFQKILSYELHEQSGEYTYTLACGHKVKSHTAPLVWVGEIFCSECMSKGDKLNNLYNKLSNAVKVRNLEDIVYYTEQIKSL